MKRSNLEETKQKCRLGTTSNEITGGGGWGWGGLQLVCGRPTLALGKDWNSRHIRCHFVVKRLADNDIYTGPCKKALQ